MTRDRPIRVPRRIMREACSIAAAVLHSHGIYPDALYSMAEEQGSPRIVAEEAWERIIAMLDTRATDPTPNPPPSGEE